MRNWGETAAAHYAAAAGDRAAYAGRLAESMKRASNPLHDSTWRCSSEEDNFRVAWRLRDEIHDIDEYVRVVNEVAEIAESLSRQEATLEHGSEALDPTSVGRVLLAMGRNESLWLAVTWLPEHWGLDDLALSNDVKLKLAEMRPIELAYLQALAYARLCEINRSNGASLWRILAKHGWPAIDRFGEKASRAAWLIAQHANNDPALQKRALQLLSAKANEGRASVEQVAYLWDRIALNEGRPQRYGTQFIPTSCGGLTLAPIEDEERIHDLRSTHGLMPLAMYKEIGERPCEEANGGARGAIDDEE